MLARMLPTKATETIPGRAFTDSQYFLKKDLDDIYVLERWEEIQTFNAKHNISYVATSPDLDKQSLSGSEASNDCKTVAGSEASKYSYI